MIAVLVAAALDRVAQRLRAGRTSPILGGTARRRESGHGPLHRAHLVRGARPARLGAAVDTRLGGPAVDQAHRGAPAGARKRTAGPDPAVQPVLGSLYPGAAGRPAPRAPAPRAPAARP